MKKTFLLFFLTTIMSISQGQKIELSTIYSEPRVGQSVPITIDLTFMEEYIENTFPPELEFVGYSAFNRFQRDIQVNEIGDYIIGPFEFEFNNKKYWTDSIIIHAIEKLEEKEGIYIRIIREENDQFIVLEQYMSNRWKRNKDSDNKLAGTISTSELEFVELIDKPIADLEFYSRKSYHKNVSLIGDNPLGYSFHIYHIKNKTGDKIVLKDSFFKNLPKNTTIPKLVINETN